MAQFFNIGPNPKWYFVNRNGKPLSGGQFNTFSSKNKQQRKSVYSQPNIAFPFPNPFPIDADGTAGPFWFLFDDTDITNGYLIIVEDANGVMVWTVDNYFASGSGGGGSVTTALNIENLINNNIFWRHCDPILTPVPTYSVIAPSNSANLVANFNLTPPVGNPGPDILFLKDTAAATDTITFPLFNLGADAVIDTFDTTPVDYFNYSCNAPDAAQTVRCLQFPITAKIQNLSNKQVNGSFWALATAVANQQITLQWFSYFGDGAGATTPLITFITTFTLTSLNVWTKLTFSATVPDAGAVGNTLGSPEFSGPNDGLFLQMQFQNPPTSTCNIGITKPTLYLGTALPVIDFQSYDKVDTVINKPRTGDVRVSHNTFAPFGWVMCNDGVLSKTSSTIVVTPPAGIPIARSNYDTYPLYSLIWAIVKANPTFSALWNNTGLAIVPFGAFAIDDFQAGNQLVLTRALGRAISAAGQASNISNITGVVTPFGPTWIDGQSVGVDEAALVQANLPPVQTNMGISSTQIIFNAAGGSNAQTLGGGGTTPVIITNPTPQTALSKMQPTAFYNVFLKL
jgi:hypothetical protein